MLTRIKRSELRATKEKPAEQVKRMAGAGRGCARLCVLPLFYAHAVHPYEKCDYKWECEWECGVPQLAWHLAWHIAARPRPLPARSNVAVNKPIKKPLLNVLSLLLFHALQHRPGGMPATWRRERGGEGWIDRRREKTDGSERKQKQVAGEWRRGQICLGDLKRKLIWNEKTFASVSVPETGNDGAERLWTHIILHHQNTLPEEAPTAWSPDLQSSLCSIF